MSVQKVIECLHKKAGSRCEKYLNGKDKSGQWKKDICGQKCYVIDGECFGGPYTMNIYLPDGCYRPRPQENDDD